MAASTRKPVATSKLAAKAMASPPTATGRDAKVAAARTASPDFSKVMETLKRVRTKSDELDDRISRLVTSLA